MEICTLYRVELIGRTTETPKCKVNSHCWDLNPDLHSKSYLESVLTLNYNGGCFGCNLESVNITFSRMCTKFQ